MVPLLPIVNECVFCVLAGWLAGGGTAADYDKRCFLPNPFCIITSQSMFGIHIHTSHMTPLRLSESTLCWIARARWLSIQNARLFCYIYIIYAFLYCPDLPYLCATSCLCHSIKKRAIKPEGARVKDCVITGVQTSPHTVASPHLFLSL